MYGYGVLASDCLSERLIAPVRATKCDDDDAHMCPVSVAICNAQCRCMEEESDAVGYSGDENHSLKKANMLAVLRARLNSYDSSASCSWRRARIRRLIIGCVWQRTGDAAWWRSRRRRLQTRPRRLRFVYVGRELRHHLRLRHRGGTASAHTLGARAGVGVQVVDVVGAGFGDGDGGW